MRTTHLSVLGLLFVALGCDGEKDTGYLDNDGDGLSGLDGDCNDYQPTVHPDLPELCDGMDNDCDGLVDEEGIDGPTWYGDSDADGYGGEQFNETACEAPVGFVDNAGDCDDLDGDINPDADEVCDEIDNNCDGTVDNDPSDAPTWYGDSDGDGYGGDQFSQVGCTGPSGFVDNGEDCDDLDSNTYPDAPEICDGLDNDCDGTADEDMSQTNNWYTDGDGDGFGDASSAVTSCEQPSNTVSNGDDCDDTDSGVNPSATEACDSKDNDCDGDTDESDAADASTWYTDADSDGYGDTNSTVSACNQPSNAVALSGDCDDTSASTHPGATENCSDSADNNCDGTVNEGCNTSNNAPVANAGADQTGTVGTTVMLDGSGSSDADGDSLAYQWTFVATPAASTISSSSISNAAFSMASFTPDVAGAYIARLQVNDASLSDTDDVTIGVSSAANNAPTANAGADATVTVGDDATLDGSNSSDPDGDTLSFSWSLVSVPSASSCITSSGAGTDICIDDPGSEVTFVTPDTAGDYTVGLLVNDGTDSDTDSLVVTATGTSSIEICNNFDANGLEQDDDGDGLANCDDTTDCCTDASCVNDTACQGGGGGGEICNNFDSNGLELDDDGDGLANCDDTTDCCTDASCVNDTACQSGGTEDCADTDVNTGQGIDNDGDGLANCDDVDDCCSDAICSSEPACQTNTGTELSEAECSDGIDNDSNGDTDCEEATCCQYNYCAGDSSCTGGGGGGGTEVTEAECMDGVDNDSNGATDCEEPVCCQFNYCAGDSSCTGGGGGGGNTELTEAECMDGVDNDSNGDTDCEEPVCCQFSYCAGDSLCTGGGGGGGSESSEAECSDGIDNDSNSATDCEEPICCQYTYCNGDSLCSGGGGGGNAGPYDGSWSASLVLGVDFDGDGTADDECTGSPSFFVEEAGSSVVSGGGSCQWAGVMATNYGTTMYYDMTDGSLSGTTLSNGVFTVTGLVTGTFTLEFTSPTTLTGEILEDTGSMQGMNFTYWGDLSGTK